MRSGLIVIFIVPDVASLIVDTVFFGGGAPADGTEERGRERRKKNS